MPCHVKYTFSYFATVAVAHSSNQYTIMITLLQLPFSTVQFIYTITVAVQLNYNNSFKENDIITTVDIDEPDNNDEVLHARADADVSVNRNDVQPIAAATLARRCDEKCEFPDRWATRLHNALSTLVDIDLPIRKMQDRILSFEDCIGCSMYGYPMCRFNATGNCRDNLKFLRAMSHHYAGLRTLERLFYDIRANNMWCLELDSTLAYGRFDDIQRQLGLCPNIPNPQVQNDAEEVYRSNETQEDVEKKFKKLIDRFDKEKRNVPVHECQICHVLHYKNEIKAINKSKAPKISKKKKVAKKKNDSKEKASVMINKFLKDKNSVLQHLIQKDGLTLPLNVCKTQSIYSCYNAILKNE